MLVVFAGCDGTGKSTLLNETEKKLLALGYKVMALKPMKQSDSFCQNLLTVKKGYQGSANDLNSRLRLLIAFETYQISLRLAEQCHNYDFVLLDRWTLCQKVYAAVWQNEEPLADHILDKCIQPDITFIIDADEKTVNERLSKREERDPVENMFALKRVLRRYRNYVKETAENVVLINNDGELEESINQIIERLIVMSREK